MKPPDGFVSVELFNLERAVADDSRERNAELEAAIIAVATLLRVMRRRDPAVYNVDNELARIIDALGKKS